MTTIKSSKNVHLMLSHIHPSHQDICKIIYTFPKYFQTSASKESSSLHTLLLSYPCLAPAPDILNRKRISSSRPSDSEHHSSLTFPAWSFWARDSIGTWFFFFLFYLVNVSVIGHHISRAVVTARCFPGKKYYSLGLTNFFSRAGFYIAS